MRIKPWQVVVMFFLASFAIVVFALMVVRLPSRHRIERLDKFCDSQIVNLRTKALFIKQHKLGAGSELVENYTASTGQWVYFRMCTTDKDSAVYEHNISLCTAPVECDVAEALGTTNPKYIDKCAPSGACVADAFEKLANTLERREP